MATDGSDLSEREPGLGGRDAYRTPGVPNVNVLTIDQMFDGPDVIDDDLRKRAFEEAIGRARNLCVIEVPADSEDNDSAIVAVSEPKPYTTPKGNQLELQLCLQQWPATRFGAAHEGVGLIIKVGDDFVSRPPVLQLSENLLWMMPATAGAQNVERRDNPADLQAFFNAMELFDGQAVLI